MVVQFNPDELHGRIDAIVPAGVRWSRFHEAVREAIALNPEWADWNWVIDDQGPMEDVDVPDMAATGEAFVAQCRHPLRQTYTVVVTSDRFFANWAKVIDSHYGGRKHLAAPTFDEAVALVKTLTGGP